MRSISLTDIGVKRCLPLGEFADTTITLVFGQSFRTRSASFCSIHRAQWHYDLSNQQVDTTRAEHVHRLVGMRGFNDAGSLSGALKPRTISP